MNPILSDYLAATKQGSVGHCLNGEMRGVRDGGRQGGVPKSRVTPIIQPVSDEEKHKDILLKQLLG